jgi:hypothetical protein
LSRALAIAAATLTLAIPAAAQPAPAPLQICAPPPDEMREFDLAEGAFRAISGTVRLVEGSRADRPFFLLLLREAGEEGRRVVLRFEDIVPELPDGRYLHGMFVWFEQGDEEERPPMGAPGTALLSLERAPISFRLERQDAGRFRYQLTQVIDGETERHEGSVTVPDFSPGRSFFACVGSTVEVSNLRIER